MKKIIEASHQIGYEGFGTAWHNREKLGLNNHILDLYLLQKFLREKKKLIIIIQLDQTSYPKYAYEIVKYVDFMTFNKVNSSLKFNLYRTYEEALEYAIIEALEIILKKDLN